MKQVIGLGLYQHRIIFSLKQFVVRFFCKPAVEFRHFISSAARLT